MLLFILISKSQLLLKVFSKVIALKEMKDLVNLLSSGRVFQALVIQLK